MDKFVEIQENQPTDGGFGEKLENWVTINSVWASIDTPSGKEISQNKDIQIDSVVIKIYLTDINNSNRIKYGVEIYDIQAAIIHNDHIKIHAMRNHDK